MWKTYAIRKIHFFLTIEIKVDQNKLKFQYSTKKD